MILAIQISFHFDVVVRSSCFIENALGEEVFIEATFLDGATPNALRDEMWLKSTFEAIYLLGYFHWYICLTCSDFLCFIYLIQLRLTFITIQLIIYDGHIFSLYLKAYAFQLSFSHLPDF